MKYVFLILCALSGPAVGFAQTSLPPGPFQFVPITPCRIIDTRGPTGYFGGPELPANTYTEFDLPLGSCGIPTNVAAYSLNLTVVPDVILGYLTLWPAGTPQPTVSTLNSDGRTKANAAIVPAGIVGDPNFPDSTPGGIDVYVTDDTQLIVDITGYFLQSSLLVNNPSVLDFYPLTPCRIVDTRQPAGPLAGPYMFGGTSRDFPVQTSSCGLPSTAQAYSLNVTAVPHNVLGYLAVWPSDQSQPVVSTLNSSTGVVTANAAIVPGAVSDGDVSVFVTDDADVILDVNGYFAAPGSGGLSLYPVTPCRALDTRTNGGPINTAISYDVGTACSVDSSAQAFVLNATAIPGSPLNYLTLWPDGQDQPIVSTLNATDGAVTSNMAIVPTTNGSIDAFPYGTTDLLLDLSSYFSTDPYYSPIPASTSGDHLQQSTAGRQSVTVRSAQQPSR